MSKPQINKTRSISPRAVKLSLEFWRNSGFNDAEMITMIEAVCDALIKEEKKEAEIWGDSIT